MPPLACSARPPLQGPPHFLLLLHTSHAKSSSFWAWPSTPLPLATRRKSVPRSRPVEVATWHESPRHLLGSHSSLMVLRAAGRARAWPQATMVGPEVISALHGVVGGPQHPHRHPLRCPGRDAPVEQEECFGNSRRC